MNGLKSLPILDCLKIIGLPCISRFPIAIPMRRGDSKKVNITAVRREISSII